MSELRLVSFNVNGLRAADRKGFANWLRKERPDVLGVQEVRASWSQLARRVRSPAGYTTFFLPAARPGYSGVGLYVAESIAGQAEFFSVRLDEGCLVSQPPGECLDAQRERSAEEETFDDEGRAAAVRVGSLTVFSVYFPNGNGKNRDNSRVPYKLAFTERLRKLADAEVSTGRSVVVMGDWNTAPTRFDLARPKQNEGTSGFLPEERASIARWLEGGWVDTLRARVPAPTPEDIDRLTAEAKQAKKRVSERELHPGEGLYTWWSQRAGVREKNIGWRIDLALLSESAAHTLRHAQTHPQVRLSDHCPISLRLAVD